MKITSSSALREKCPKTEFFLVRIFLYTGKYGPEKTPYWDTFHSVLEYIRLYIIIVVIDCYLTIKKF